MNLLDLFVKIGVDDEASKQMDTISSSMIAKGQLIASAIQNAVSAAFQAIRGLIGGALDAYGAYEQQVGGMETLFKNASDTVIANAKEAYNTAGMSANEYMRNAASFAASLVTSVARERQQALDGDTASQEEAAAQQIQNAKEALDRELSDFQNAQSERYRIRSEELQDELSAVRDAYAEQYQELQESLQDEISARREALAEELSNLTEQLSEQVDARRQQLADELKEFRSQQSKSLSQAQETNRKLLNERKKSLQRQLDATSDSLSKEVREFSRATDAKVKEMDREYREQLSYIDRTLAAQLSAIDEQIDAIDGQTDAEEKALRQQERNTKMAELEKQLANARTKRGIEKATKELSEYRAQVEREETLESRKERIAQLRDSQDILRQQASEQKSTLQEQYQSELEEYKAARSAQLEEMRKANAEQVKAQREANEALLEQMSKNQEAQIARQREANDAEAEQRSRQNERIIAQMQKANKQQIAEQSKQNAAVIKQMQSDANTRLKEQQRANNEALKELQRAQQQELRELQLSQAQQLAEMRQSVSDRKEAFTSAVDEQSSYVEAMAEDYERAAELADVAMRDMSDNANKMGSDMQSIEAAYQGFSKQNFTMLDNLKLGYGGTKAEMERLLQDAESIKAKYGEVKDYSVDSFADIVDAIHTVQVEMGISGLSIDELKQKMSDNDFTLQELGKLREAWGMQGSTLDEVRQKADELKNHTEEFSSLLGTTASEGANTYEGAINRVKAAWENWLISLTDPEWDVEQSTKDLMTSVGDAAAIIIPRVAEILTTVWNYVKEHGPEIWETLKQGFIDSLPPEWKQKAQEYIEKFEGLMNSVKDFADSLAGLAKVIDTLTTPFRVLGEGIGEISANINAAFDDTMMNEQELKNFNDQKVTEMLDKWTTYPDEIKKKFINADSTLTKEGQSIIDGFMAGAEGKWNESEGWWTSRGEWIKKNKGPEEYDRQLLVPAGDNIIYGLMKGAEDKWDAESGFFSGMGNTISSFFDGSSDLLFGAGQSIMNGFWDGLDNVWRNLSGWVSGIGQWIQDNKGPESYDKKLLVKNGKWIMYGLRKGLTEDFEGNVVPYVSGMADEMGDSLGLPEMRFDSMLEDAKNASTVMAETFMDMSKTIEFALSDTSDAIAQNSRKMVESLMRDSQYMQRDYIDAFQRIEGAANKFMSGMHSVYQSAPGGNVLAVNVGNMEVRNEQDIYRVAEQLNDLWRRNMEGALAGALR